MSLFQKKQPNKEPDRVAHNQILGLLQTYLEKYEILSDEDKAIIRYTVKCEYLKKGDKDEVI